MAYSYKDDLDRFNEKKNDSKKLTLNSLNLASDAGLDPTYGGDGSGAGIDLGITGASVGEYAKIKTVDADGVPTAWEGGSGGGGALVEIGVTSENGTLTLQKTLQEILDYIESGLIPYINHDPSEGLTVGDFLFTLFKSAGANSSTPGTIDGYFINFGDLYFECASLTDYPVGS